MIMHTYTQWWNSMVTENLKALMLIGSILNKLNLNSKAAPGRQISKWQVKLD